MLNDVVVVIRTRPRAISSAIFTMRKAGRFCAREYGAACASPPFRPPELRRKKVQDRKGSSEYTPLRRSSTIPLKNAI